MFLPMYLESCQQFISDYKQAARISHCYFLEVNIRSGNLLQVEEELSKLQKDTSSAKESMTEQIGTLKDHMLTELRNKQISIDLLRSSLKSRIAWGLKVRSPSQELALPGFSILQFYWRHQQRVDINLILHLHQFSSHACPVDNMNPLLPVLYSRHYIGHACKEQFAGHSTSGGP